MHLRCSMPRRARGEEGSPRLGRHCFCPSGWMDRCCRARHEASSAVKRLPEFGTPLAASCCGTACTPRNTTSCAHNGSSCSKSGSSGDSNSPVGVRACVRANGRPTPDSQVVHEAPELLTDRVLHVDRILVQPLDEPACRPGGARPGPGPGRGRGKPRGAPLSAWDLRADMNVSRHGTQGAGGVVVCGAAFSILLWPAVLAVEAPGRAGRASQPARALARMRYIAVWVWQRLPCECMQPQQPALPLNHPRSSTYPHCTARPHALKTACCHASLQCMHTMRHALVHACMPGALSSCRSPHLWWRAHRRRRRPDAARPAGQAGMCMDARENHVMPVS